MLSLIKLYLYIDYLSDEGVIYLPVIFYIFSAQLPSVIRSIPKFSVITESVILPQFKGYPVFTLGYLLIVTHGLSQGLRQNYTGWLHCVTAPGLPGCLQGFARYLAWIAPVLTFLWPALPTSPQGGQYVIIRGLCTVIGSWAVLKLTGVYPLL